MSVSKFTTSLAFVAAAFALSACSEEGVPSGDPRKYVTSKIRGYVAHDKVMAGKNGALHWVQEAMRGWHKTDEYDAPAKISWLKSAKGCHFTPPEDDEKVVSVHVSQSAQRSPVYTIAKKELSKRAVNFVKLYKDGDSSPPSQASPSGDRLNLVDVVVTDRSKPLYLVLTGQYSVLWNIHPADGVKINKIAIVSYDGTGIVNAPAGANVTVLTGKQRKRCKVNPIRKPREHWSLMRDFRAGAYGIDRKVIAKNRGAHKRFSNWHRKAFGVSAGKNNVYMNRVSHVLIGKLPAKLNRRVNYRPFAEGHVQLSKVKHVIVADRTEYRSKHRALVKKLVEKTLGRKIASK